MVIWCRNYLNEGTIVDDSIIEATSSTKNKAKSRDPEIHQSQTGKGKQGFFRLKARVGVEGITGLMYNVNTPGANLHDITERGNLLHGE